MITRALTYDGFIKNPDWVYIWNDHEWGASGVAHFYRPGEIVSPTRLVLDHILDRLGIELELRHAWCVSHAEDVVVMEFRGEWPASTPPGFRRRVMRPRIGSMWDHGLYRKPSERTRDPGL